MCHFVHLSSWFSTVRQAQCVTCVGPKPRGIRWQCCTRWRCSFPLILGGSPAVGRARHLAKLPLVNTASLRAMTHAHQRRILQFTPSESPPYLLRRRALVFTPAIPPLDHEYPSRQPPTAPRWPTVTPITKQDWHASIDLSARRSVLLHILVLLKSKYGRVDAKISYIGRRAELALYSQAYSAWEYRNPQTLSRRLHSLVVKLHLNNLAAVEDAAFVEEQAQFILQEVATRKRKFCAIEDDTPVGKRVRLVAAQSSSPLFFNGNSDLLQHVCSFLSAPDVLHCAATCSQAVTQLPNFVTSIDVSTAAMLKLSPAHRAFFFKRFVNLKSFSLTGCSQAEQFNFQDEKALISRNVLVRSVLLALGNAELPKLSTFSLNFCYSMGLKDHITKQVAEVLVGSSSRFPRLQSLSLVGNCISDDAVSSLYDALALPGSSRLAFVDLSQNFIGERGHVQMQELVSQFASRGAALVVNIRNNLLTGAVSAA